MAFRVIQQSLWTDEKVLDSYSCEDKYFWLYLLTNPQTNQLGIYKMPLKLAAFQLGYSKEQVLVLLDRFEKVLKQIKYNKEPQELAIGNFLYHSVITGGKPVISTIEKDISKVTDVELFDFVIDKLSNKTITNQTVLQAIELLKEKSTKKENIKDKENDKHNDNDNENDNGDSQGDSSPDSQESIYTPEKEIFDFWNSKDGVIKSHEKSFDKGKISTAIKNYGYQEIITAIKRLSDAVTDNGYYYNFNWNIYKFLKQSNGISNWLDDGQLWNDYESCLSGTKKIASNSFSQNQKASFMDIDF